MNAAPRLLRKRTPGPISSASATRSRTLSFASQASTALPSIPSPLSQSFSISTPDLSTSAPISTPDLLLPRSDIFDSSSRPPPAPDTPAAQYWAARALHAETLLASRTAHHAEVRRVISGEDGRRTRELNALGRRSDARQARAERVIALLIATSFALALALLATTLLRSTARPSLSSAEHHRAPWLSRLAGGAGHFTISVLSPFTTVVEHDASLFPIPVVLGAAAALALLAYFMWRHWLSRQSGRGQAHMREGKNDIKGVLGGRTWW